jgi:Holliday junction resolvase RusA-like endonuclease
MRLEFDFDAFPYTRQMATSRFGVKPGGQLDRYYQWKKRVRDRLNCEQIDGPVSFSLHVKSPIWTRRDVDNLLKGAADVLNPEVGLKMPHIAPGAWIDDGQMVECYAKVEYSPKAGFTVFVEPLFDDINAFGFGRIPGGSRDNLDTIKLVTRLGTYDAPIHPLKGEGRPLWIDTELEDHRFPAYETLGEAHMTFMADSLGCGAHYRKKGTINEKGLAIIAENTGSTAPNAVEHVFAQMANVKKVDFEDMAKRLYLEAGAAWPSCRLALRKALARGVPISDFGTLAMLMPQRKVKKAKKKSKKEKAKP